MSKLEQLEKKLEDRISKAVFDYNMIQTGDKIMVCLSGGKDSFTLLSILNKMKLRSNNKFSLFAFTLDQGQPGWDDTGLREWLIKQAIPFEILKEDTYSIVIDKVPSNKTYCGLCSRLRRGIIYRYATEHGFKKIALGHHRDDLIQTLLMSILYTGSISAMPPKLLSVHNHIVIRPMAYCQEETIQKYAELRQFPIIPCNLCGSQTNLTRNKIKQLIKELAKDNRKVPSNMLHALTAVRPSQLMDHDLWDFKGLEGQQANSACQTADEYLG